MSIDVSVIIATYNLEHYLKNAIDSVLSQENVTVEIIAVDDCSTDKTWEILSAYNQPNIKCVQLPQNSGPSAARNEALKHAKGDWIAIFDGDDYMNENRLSNCIQTAKSHNADIVIDNQTIFNEETGETRIMFPQNIWNALDTLSLADYIEGNCFTQKSHTLGYTKPIIKRDVIKKHNIKYNESIRIGEDYLFMAELLASGATCAINNNADYRYTVRSSSISHRLSAEAMNTILETDQKFLEKYSLSNEEKKAQRKREKSIKEIYAFNLLVEALKSKNIIGVFQSLILCPTAPRHLSEAICKRLNKRCK